MIRPARIFRRIKPPISPGGFVLRNRLGLQIANVIGGQRYARQASEQFRQGDGQRDYTAGKSHGKKLGGIRRQGFGRGEELSHTSSYVGNEQCNPCTAGPRRLASPIALTEL